MQTKLLIDGELVAGEGERATFLLYMADLLEENELRLADPARPGLDVRSAAEPGGSSGRPQAAGC